MNLFNSGLAALLLFPLALTAQQPARNWSCGSDIVRRNALNDPAAQQRQMQIDQDAWHFFSQTTTPAAARGLQIVTLPVVVHIIHDNGPENISDAQVLNGIQQLNEAFANAAYYDQGTGTNTMIQFCLAKRTPDGLATNGITRDQSALTDMILETDDLPLKDLNRWTPTDYINIWLVREICSLGSGCGVAGYAYFPSSHGSSVDGIVMEAEYLGATPGGTGVLAHEMGHYLGLYHTFEGGCTNDDCLADGDRVCDTPPDQSTLWVSCDAVVNTCNTDAQSGFSSDQPDMILNFMDYTDFDCFNDFTAGQSDRMHWHIDNVRSSLLESKACLDPCPNPVTAQFTASALLVNVGGTVTFTNTSSNANTYVWTVNGAQISTATNASYTFNNEGNYTVTLSAQSANPVFCSAASYSVNIQVVCPVTANFTVSNPTPSVGETVQITNLSQGASQLEWFLDGVSQGSVFPTFTPNSTGVFVIRLVAGNGFCEKTEIAYLSVQDSCAEFSFQKTWGNNNASQGYQAITLADGNTLLCGTTAVANANNILFSKINPNGTALWQRHYGGPGNEVPRRVLALPDGGWMLVGGLPGAQANSTRPLLARFAPDGSVTWQTTMQVTDVVNVFTDIQFSSDGNLLVSGSLHTSATVGSACFLMKVTLNGSVVWAKIYDGSYIDWIEGICLMPDGSIGAVGFTSSFGQNTFSIHDGLAMRFDVDGNILWVNACGSFENEWLTHIFPTADGGLMAIGATSGWNGGVGGVYHDDGWMVKFSSGGQLQWSRIFQSDQNIDFGIQGVVTSADGGYVMAANDVSNISDNVPLYFKTDANGTIEWSRVYNNTGQGRLYSVDRSGDGYVLAGYVNDGAQPDAWLLRCDAAGVAGLCTQLPHQLSAQEVQPVITPGPMTVITAPPLNTVNLSTTVISLPEQTPCAPDCASAGDCEDTWIRRFGLNNVSEGGTNLIASPDGNFYLNGYRGDSTLLMKMTPDGQLLWSRSFKFSSGSVERVSQIIVDTDGNLVGCGMFDGGNGLLGFTFKYDPSSDQVLWAWENPANPQTVYFAILEKTPGGNYLAFNSYHDSPSPGSYDDEVIVELDRNTGQMNGLKQAYSFGSSEGAIEAQVHNGSLYTAGRYTYGNGYPGMRGAISRFNLNGVETWSRMMFFNDQFSARNYATDFTFDGDNLVTIYYGDFSGEDGFTNEFAINKVSTDGNQIWAKKYSIAAPNQVFTKSIITVSDGYVVLATNVAFDQPASIFLIKIDKDGNLMWARDYRDMYVFRGEKMLVERNGFLYFIAESAFGNGDVAVAKVTAADGLVGGDCGYPLDLAVAAEDLPMVNQPVDLVDYQSVISQGQRNVSPKVAALPPTNICFQACSNEICNNGLDDDGDGLFDCLDPDCDCKPCDGEQARFWYFGDGAGLDFATSPPTVLTNGATFSREASSVATDMLGNLLFYTDADQLFDRNHQLMPNGTGLAGHSSTTQTLILPQPGMPWRFFVFTPNSYDNLSTGEGLAYSVVDMSLNGGLGDVAAGQKNIQMLSSVQFTEKITATRHCNGEDWWILVKEAGNNRFRAYPLTAAGLGAPVISNVGTPGSAAAPNVIGCLKFSPNGRIAANTLYHTGGVDFFEFDNSTGVLSNPQTVTQGGMSGAYGLEFSPDGEQVYLTSLTAPSHIWQIVLDNALAGSALPFSVAQFPSEYHFGQLQRGPDNKIYVTNTAPLVFTPTLGVINQPNALGAACAYQEGGLNIAPGGANLGLPSFPQDFFPKSLTVKIDGPDTLCQVPGALDYELFIDNPCIVDSVRWKLTGMGTLTSATDQGASVQITAAGTAQLTVIVYSECVIQTDTLLIHAFDEQVPVLDLGPDLQECDNGVEVLHAGPGFDRYKWNTGSSDSTITTLFPGTYWVDVWDRCGNKQSDTITISIMPATALDLGPDRLVCAGTTLSYALPADFTGWVWSPASGLNCTDCPVVQVTAGDTVTYIVVAHNGELCVSADTLTVTGVTDTIEVSIDTMICSNETLSIFGVVLPPDTVAIFSFTTPGGCDSILTVTVTGIDPVQSMVSESICPGDTLMYHGAVITSDTTLQFVLNGSNGCDSLVQLDVVLLDTSTTFVMLEACPGSFVTYNGVDIPTGETRIIKLPGGSGVCDSTVIVTVTALSAPTILMVATDTLVAGDTLQLNPQVNGFGPYQWQWSPLPPPEWLSCYTCPNPVASPIEDIIYTVQVTDAQGCSSLDSIALIVLPCPEPFVPNAFTPDDDGTNDWFYILAPDCVVEVLYLRIYARWGELVFERTNFPANIETLGWDGRFRGKDFPTDVLVWLAEVKMPDGTVLRKKGDVTLLR